jgi:hypothetical protein
VPLASACMGPVRELTERLIPGVVAVALGGARANGPIHPDSDWHFGLHCRDAISAEDVRALGFEGTVVEAGEWGRLVNGGAWLTVEGQRVDLLRSWISAEPPPSSSNRCSAARSMRPSGCCRAASLGPLGADDGES